MYLYLCNKKTDNDAYFFTFLRFSEIIIDTRSVSFNINMKYINNNTTPKQRYV